MIISKIFQNKFFYLPLICIASLLLLESLFRIAGKKNGNYLTVFNKTYFIQPSLKHWEAKYEKIIPLLRSPDSYGQYDSLLGWSIRPHKIPSNPSLYTSNLLGIRANRNYTQDKDTSIARIALFGDSFTHGQQVRYQETWGHYLEERLKERGVSCEVMNFGVAGYGMDQAFLRWKRDGKPFKPDIVVFGLQMENFWRNLNVYRPNYIPTTSGPLTKPRAMIEMDTLQWFNIPPIPPSHIIDSVLFDFKHSRLYPYEYFYQTILYEKLTFLNKFYSYIVFKNFLLELEKVVLKKKPIEKNIDKCYEGQKLTNIIIKEFKKDVNDIGAKFILLQLPMADDIITLKKSGKLSYSEYLESFIKKYPFCRTDRLLLNHKINDIFFPHYTPLGNKIIGEYFADFLLKHNFL